MDEARELKRGIKTKTALSLSLPCLEKRTQLYSVNWYKDFVEFYRFKPAEGQARERQDFGWEGISLDVSGLHVGPRGAARRT